MDLNVFYPHELDAVLRALSDVAIANGCFTDGERDFVQSIARIHGASVDVDSLRPIPLEEVAKVVTEPHPRKRAVQLAIAMAFVEGDPTERSELAVRALASALDVS